MAKTHIKISDAEMDVLRVLWDEGSCTVRTANDRLSAGARQWAYTTVQTLLGRLEAKGYVACDKSTVPHVFRAAVSRERLMQQRLRNLADELCDGAASPLVMSLVENQKFSKSELKQFRRLLDEAGMDEEDEGSLQT